MRTTAVQSVACGRPSRPAPGREDDSAPRVPFLLLRSDGERALHPEVGVVAYRADQLVAAGREGGLRRVGLAGPEDRGAAEVLAVLLHVQVVGERALVAEHEADGHRLRGA